MSYIPASTKGSIIITSRYVDMEVPGSLRISVNPLDSLSGATLLHYIVHAENCSEIQQNRPSAEEISKIPGGLPLPIVMAGAYILMMNMSLAEYLQSLGEQRSLLFSSAQTSKTWQYPKTLANVFDDTLRSLSPDARDLLDCMAFLDPDGIPEPLFLRKESERSRAFLDLSRSG